MKISKSALALCLLPYFATSFAPISTIHYSVSSTPVSLESSRTDQGWNNDNFLDALSGNSEDIEKVNEEYKLQSASRQEMRSRQLQSMINQDESNQEYLQLLQEEQKAQMQRIQSGNNVEKESVSGGQRLQEMTAQAQPEVAAPIAPPVPPTQPAAPATPVTASQSQVTPEAMEYYQQQLKGWQQLMQGYAQVLAANPEAAAQMTMPQPPPPPPGYVSPNAIATPAPTAAASTVAQPVQSPPPQKEYIKDEQGNLDPKQFLVSGNNRDAYEITNPADVYLAQLKRDSTVRTEARKRGDVETANQVFEDVGVKALKDLLSDELIKRRRDQLAENGGEFETSRDEMILPYEEEEEYEDKSYTGISYREKLMEMKKKRAGGSNSE